MCDIRDATPAGEPESNGVEGVPAFVNELLLALTNSRIYSADHPRVQVSLQALSASLDRHLTLLQTDAIQIGASGGYLFFDRRPLLAASRSAPRLIRILESMGSGGLALHRGAAPEEFLSLAHVLGQQDVESLTVLRANLELERAGAPNIRMLPAYVDGTLGGGGWEEGDDEIPDVEVPLLEVPARLYHHVFEHLTDVVTSVFRGDLFRLDETRAQVQKILKELGRDAGAMLSSSHYEHTRADQFQFRHAIRVAYLALSLARSLTGDEQTLLRIGTAALLHDVGKGRLDWALLHKPGRLTDEERLEMERHTEFGARLLLQLEDTDPLAVAIAFGHHRREGGGGYPKTVFRPELSMGTHVVKICDVFEALTARRPYKEPMTPTRSFQIMLKMNAESGGTQFHAALLHRFMLVHGIYPAGSWVEMDGGDHACIVSQTGEIVRPVVEVRREVGPSGGEEAPLDIDPYRLDLHDEAGDAGRHIVRWLGYGDPCAA